MVKLDKAFEYSDDNGNRIIYDGPEIPANIIFRGKNNTLRINKGVRFGSFDISFDCDGGLFDIGSHRAGIGDFKGNIRIGQDSKIIIGDDVTCTSRCYFSCVERSTIVIGNDCMFASGNEIRSDDSHAIFDVNTGLRVNIAQDVRIGAHVWLGTSAVVFGGSRIGEGSVIGRSAIVTSDIPNNVVAVGMPARTSKRDIAWERPHLSLHKPFFKGDETTIKKSQYWNKTLD